MGAPARYTPVLLIDDEVIEGTGLTLPAPGDENGLGGVADVLDDRPAPDATSEAELSPVC